jgi:pyrroloquinoline quinone biosynthesis protein D
MSDEIPSIPPEARPRLNPKVRVQTDKVSGKPALLYPEGVLLLNPTGAAIVELCDGSHPFATLVAALAERYSAPPDVLSGDVAEYLNRLRDRGLLDLLTNEETP